MRDRTPASAAALSALTLAVATTLGATSVTTDAAAQSRRHGGEGYVTARSHYGNGVVSGPVRRSGRGHYEVRMPGGTWISCKSDCAQTLREETIDFWQERQKLSPGRSR